MNKVSDDELDYLIELLKHNADRLQYSAYLISALVELRRVRKYLKMMGLGGFYGKERIGSVKA